MVEPQLPPITHPEWIFFFKTLKNIPGTHEDFASTKDSFIKLLRKSKKKCPLLRPLLRLITIPHLQWQRHTILISFARKDFASQIYHAIDTKQTSKCHLCYNKDRRESLCPITKKLKQQQRFKTCINPRKDNQNGVYAQRSLFHLLTQTLIPAEVFQAYEQTFIPFFPR